jgi:subtilisin
MTARSGIAPIEGMFYRTFPIVGLVVALLASAVPAAAAEPSDVVPNQYVVLLADAAPDAEQAAADLSRRHGLARGHAYKAVKGFVSTVPSNRLASLAADPLVESVAPDRYLDLDALSVDAAQRLPTGVDRVDADRARTAAGDGRGKVDADVAVLDTGIDPTHPDLDVVGGYNCTSKKVDAWTDDAGHGTHVAGVVAARDDAAGVVGVAPGARLWAVKVGTAKKIKTSDVICGLDWVARNAATIEVANMSFSGAGVDRGRCGGRKKDPLHAAVCRATAAGVTLVASAGNAGVDLADYVPAAYDEVLTVTAMSDLDGRPGGLGDATCRPGETDDTAATFSNYAVTSADAAHTIAAPGVCIRTTYPRVLDGGKYITSSGTSAAAPHAAGAVALCHATGPCAGLSPAQIIAHLRSTAAAQPPAYGFAGDPTRPLPARYYGHLLYAAAY